LSTTTFNPRSSPTRHRELLRELVEHPEFSAPGRILDREAHTLDGVDDVEEATGLTTLAVHTERVTHDCLNTKAIEGCTEYLVVIEACTQPFVEIGFVGPDSVHDPLVQVGGTKFPDPAREMDVVRVVNLRQVVHRSRELRIREYIGAAVVVDLDEALFDVDVRGPVLSHGSQLHQMRVRGDVSHGVKDVQRALDVVSLGENGTPAIDHRIRSAGLLSVVDYPVGPDLFEHLIDEVRIGEVPHERMDLVAGDFAPRPYPLLQRLQGGERTGADLHRHPPAQKVIYDRDVVTGGRKMHCRGPSKVAVAAQYQDFHRQGGYPQACMAKQSAIYTDKSGMFGPVALVWFAS
jgi:hypothetical protein